MRYSGSIQVDRHAESSLPSPDVDVFCNIISDVDGYNVKIKHVIGNNIIDFLVTCSVVLAMKLIAFVGPSMDFLTGALDSAGKHSQLYLRRSCIEQFRKFKLTISAVSIAPTPKPTKLLQIMSAFDHKLAHAMLHETLPGLPMGNILPSHGVHILRLAARLWWEMWFKGKVRQDLEPEQAGGYGGK